MQLSFSGWVLAGLSTAAVGVLAPDTLSAVDDLTSTSFPDAALGAASLLVLGIAAWSLVVTVAVLLGASSRLVAAITPVALRQLLVAGAAGALTIAPAHAEQQAAPDASQHSVAGLTLPDRPDAARPRHVVEHEALDEPAPATPVRVRPGDTLWAIAQRSLPPTASTSEIASATQAWHRANRDVIGDDPNLIVPAQLLAPPSAKDLP